MHAERVNVSLHQVAERSIYHPMSLKSFGPGELHRHDRDTEMATAIFRTGVACVTMTVVYDLERLRGESRLESRTNFRNSFAAHG